MNKKKVGVIASACATCAVCASMIVGSTYALFTGNDKVDISVTAGTVQVSAEVDKSSVKLESMGEKQEGNSWANGGTAGFNDKSELELTYITPGDKATFDIKVTNNSTVNIQYRINWSVEGELADALVATANVAKFGYWTEWTAPKTDEEKVKTVSVSVELPASAGNEYQGAETSISFAVEAVQGNAEVMDEVASVNGVGYATLAEALAAANAGDTIKLTHSEGGEEVQTLEIDKDVKIVGNGEATVNNTHIIVKNNAEVTFDEVNFEGDCYINVADASALNMTGCDADVHPSQVIKSNGAKLGRASFIVSDRETTQGLKLNIVGNKINSSWGVDDSFSTAIFVWSYVDDSVIANNVFGSPDSLYTAYIFTVIETLNAMNNATIKVENNTMYCGVYDNNEAYIFDFGQNNSRANKYTVISKNNVIHVNEDRANAKAYAFCVEVMGAGKNTLTLIDEGTTLNGRLVGLDDVDWNGECYLYVSINGEKRLSVKAEEVSTADEFTAALNNANVSYIVLGDDITVSGKLAINKNVTLDLDGKTITKTANTASSSHLFDVASGVTATIKNGNVIDDHSEAAEKAYGYVINNKGNLTLDGLNIESRNNNSSLIHNGYAEVNQAAGKDDAKLTVNGGSYVSHSICALKADLCSETVINGGTFETYSGYAVECYGTLTVNGGTFKANGENGTALLITGGDFWGDPAYPDVTINGGDFTGAVCSIEAGNGYWSDFDEEDHKLQNSVKVVINDGKFNNVAVYSTPKGDDRLENTLMDGDSFVIYGGTFADNDFPEWVTVIKK